MVLWYKKYTENSYVIVSVKDTDFYLLQNGVQQTITNLLPGNTGWKWKPKLGSDWKKSRGPISPVSKLNY